MIGLSYFTKKDAVAEWLRNEILSGKLASGAPLLQDEIAQRLNVSPTPVREAFRELEAEGIIVSRPHRGVVVSERDHEDQKAVYEIRTLLEAHVTRRIATSLPEGTLGELAALVKQSERALRTADLHSTRDANARFHDVLMAQAGSRVYADLARSLISQSRYYLPLSRARMTEVAQAHRGILRALQARDPEQAGSQMERHMSANLKWLYQARTKAATAHRRTNPRANSKRRPS